MLQFLGTSLQTIETLSLGPTGVLASPEWDSLLWSFKISSNYILRRKGTKKQFSMKDARFEVTPLIGAKLNTYIRW